MLQLLQTYHPYYSQHAQNKLFAVLTQSCDLVRRGDTCGARYISLAPVRPLRAVLKREFEGALANVGPGCQAFASHRVRTSFEQFLERLFHNNEPPFFFYEVAHAIGISEEMCAMLALPISLKPDHYETLLAAKLTGIEDVFQAKLGWLLGQMYSRVGTPDFEPGTVSKMVKAYTDGVAVWLDEGDAKALQALVDALRAQPDSGAVGANQLRALIDQLPKRKNQVIGAVLEVAARVGLVGEKSPERLKFRRELEKDPLLASYFPRR